MICGRGRDGSSSSVRMAGHPRASETGGRKSDRSFDDWARCGAHVAFRRRLAIPYLHRRRVTTGGNSAPLSSPGIFMRDSLTPKMFSLQMRTGVREGAPCGKLSFVARDDRKLFNRVSSSGRQRRRVLLSHLCVAASLRAFYFRPFVPAARPAGTNRRYRRNLDRGKSSTGLNRSHASLSAECVAVAQIVSSLQIVKIRCNV